MNAEQIAGQLAACGLPCDGALAGRLAVYGEMLLDWNTRMDLTAVTEEDGIILRHFADSLSALAVPGLVPAAGRLIDVGTGAGFPGMVLALACPQLQVTLLDALQKRLNFLDEVIDENRFENIRTLHGRAEDIGRSKIHREQYDLCVSRAVANLSSLCEYCLPLVKTGGCFISFKTMNAGKEIKNAQKAVRILGGEIEKIHEFVLPGTDLGRTLVVIRKKQATPAGYPRKAGTPAKDPIH